MDFDRLGTSAASEDRDEIFRVVAARISQLAAQFRINLDSPLKHAGMTD
jgi:hypothetical protein